MGELHKMISWRDRYGDGGICDFKMNYSYYLKWLLNKVMQIIVIKGLDGTKINGNYLKSQLIMDGNICITDYEDGVNHEAGIYVQRVLGLDFVVPPKQAASATTQNKREHSFG